MGRQFEGRIAKERVERRQAQIPTADAEAVTFEIIEKGHDQRGINLLERQDSFTRSDVLRRSSAGVECRPWSGRTPSARRRALTGRVVAESSARSRFPDRRRIPPMFQGRTTAHPTRPRDTRCTRPARPSRPFRSTPLRNRRRFCGHAGEDGDHRMRLVGGKSRRRVSGTERRRVRGDGAIEAVAYGFIDPKRGRFIDHSFTLSPCSREPPAT